MACLTRSRADLEAELLDQVQRAYREFTTAEGPARREARETFQALLRKFNALVLENKIPEE